MIRCSTCQALHREGEPCPGCLLRDAIPEPSVPSPAEPPGQVRVLFGGMALGTLCGGALAFGALGLGLLAWAPWTTPSPEQELARQALETERLHLEEERIALEVERIRAEEARTALEEARRVDAVVVVPAVAPVPPSAPPPMARTLRPVRSVASAPPRPPGDCDDLRRIEALAVLGRVPPEQIACLEDRLAGPDAESISRLLAVNHFSAGDKEGWRTQVRWHVDRFADPDLSFKLALDASHRQDVVEALEQAERALAGRSTWTGNTYTTRVFSLHKLRANMGQLRWERAEAKREDSAEAAVAADRAHEQAKSLAAAWLAFARASGKRVEAPTALCMRVDC